MQKLARFAKAKKISVDSIEPDLPMRIRLELLWLEKFFNKNILRGVFSITPAACILSYV